MDWFYDGGMMTEEVPELRVNLRLKGEHARRLQMALEQTLQRNIGKIELTDALVELIFLMPPRIFNEEDRKILRHGTLAPHIDHPNSRALKHGRAGKS